MGRRSKQVEVHCDTCGRLFKVQLYRLKRKELGIHQGLYCSIPCSLKARKGERKKSPPPRSEETRRKMSIGAIKKWNKTREVRFCPICGRFFEVISTKKQQFCSRDCAYKARTKTTSFSRSKGGKREDLGGVYFRSSYEANYARYLNYLIANGDDIEKWEYEADTFEFEKIRKGVRFYTPDFKVTFGDGHIEYHEVKGWDYPRGKTARKRMQKYYPHIKLLLVERDFFRAVRAQGFHRLIPNWE